MSDELCKAIESVPVDKWKYEQRESTEDVPSDGLMTEKGQRRSQLEFYETKLTAIPIRVQKETRSWRSYSSNRGDWTEWNWHKPTYSVSDSSGFIIIDGKKAEYHYEGIGIKKAQADLEKRIAAREKILT